MSTTTAPEPTPSGNPAVSQNDWALTWQGVRTMVSLELRQRVRSTRWKVALVVWFAVVGVVTFLASGAMNYLFSTDTSTDLAAGRTMFGLVAFFVLFVGLLVAPALTAPAINGDRESGTLATLQATLLTSAEIVLGKLLAAWLAALTFLAASVPFIVWAFAAGGLPLASLVSVLAVLIVVLGVVCAIGLGFSALLSRTSGSAVLTYLTVGGLSVATVIFFGLGAALNDVEEEVEVWTVPDYVWDTEDPVDESTLQCEWQTQTMYRTHTERVWWLLAPNPFVVVADAQPLADGDQWGDPLSAIQLGVRHARSGPPPQEDWCWNESVTSPVEPREPSEEPVWPWGLGILVLMGAGGVVTAVRRLHLPMGTLAKGTRVA